jgi:hypothetical protein
MSQTPTIPIEETVEYIEASKAYRVVHSEDYLWLKEKFKTMMMAADSLSLMDTSMPAEELGIEIKANKKSVLKVQSWFDLIETQAQTFETYNNPKPKGFIVEL